MAQLSLSLLEFSGKEKQTNGWSEIARVVGTSLGRVISLIFWQTLAIGIALLFGVVLGMGAQGQTAGTGVVTGAEAALPPSPTSKAGRAITRGPAIRQVSPASAVVANQPFTLKVEFAGRGGEKINVSSAQVSVLRGNNVDITSRLKPFITETGIEIPNALVPAGTYALQVMVSDSGGRQSLANVEIEAR